MAFIKNSYGDLTCQYRAIPKCSICMEEGEPKYFGNLEDAVAHLEQNSVCNDCLFEDEKKNKHDSKGKKG